MALAKWLGSYYVCPLLVLERLYCHQMITQTNAKADRRLCEEVKPSKYYSSATKDPTKNKFRGFRGVMALATWT